MLKIISIIGARPQIIKAAALSRAIKNHYSGKIKEVIVKTGQHYDYDMSQVFIEELGLPEPAYNLSVGSSLHGKQTGMMIERIEEVLLKEDPDFVVVYGDTNSTLAAALAASKLNIPIAHIEAGMRSFNKQMPEEINRIVCDHTSTLLFTPTETGLDNLKIEGFSLSGSPPYSVDKPGIFHCGDVMYDNTLYFENLANNKSQILRSLEIQEKDFYLATIHRNNNTDRPERLGAIFSALDKISRKEKRIIVLPLHPRTSKAFSSNLPEKVRVQINNNSNLKIIPPVSFLDIILLEKHCDMIFTDSGGLQKEAYFFHKPVIILRSETEWKEIDAVKTGIITDADEKRIIDAHDQFKNKKDILSFPPIFGDGHAAEFICEKLLETKATS